MISAPSPLAFRAQMAYFHMGTLLMDSSGNLYGTAQLGRLQLRGLHTGGSGTCGVIFKITP